MRRGLNWVDRITCRYMADCLGLRVLTLRRRDGYTIYALWPAEGLAWELHDPPVATSWAGLRMILDTMTRARFLRELQAVGRPAADCEGGDTARLATFCGSDA